ncbi:AMP-binding protein [Mycolicibacterium pulveris]|uniref:ATP-dependent acyl-CoA ligase n=1 Tax=Mycolicibacterium pulveris TaxID=36813 RepID=A0A7I7USE8_MYCPV|nr:AMP-binding protein [Mycolicibacterium pulveris]MCV6983837.1 AMP-binding protein [Mycolicibacterium pulveris]BBY83721.1 ATP-dependent acyl-CoA ligase [Mycolicibacterium pulveris]
MTRWSAPELTTMRSVLSTGAEKAPDKIALHIDDEALTYSELYHRGVSAAVGLHSLGIRPGDAVGVFAHNSTDLLATMFGCAFLGAVYTPINVDYTGEFLRHQLATAEARVVLTDAALIDEIGCVASKLPDLAHVIARPGGTSPPAAGPEIRGVSIHPVAEVYAPATQLPAGPDPRGDSVSAVIFTAGTTGPSKGVAMSQNYLCASAKQVFDLRGATADSTVYAAFPLFHLAAISLVVLGPLTATATGALDNRFSPNKFWSRVHHFAADQTVLLGAMSTMLWNRPEQEDDAENPVQVATIAPMPPAVHRAFEKRFGLTVLQLYAQSEAYPLTIAPASAPALPGSSGKPNPLFTVKLFDEHDAEVPVGEVGEVVVRPNAPHVMFEGYYRNPEATASVWRNGWMHTGDLGKFDDDGYFYFVDRKKDYLRRRGENISSFEVEQVARQYEPVADVAVIAAPSEVTEDEVVACVTVKGDETFDCEAFFHHCAANMPYFAVPRYVWILPDLPRNPVGRVEKYKLRDTLRTADMATLDGLWDARMHGCVAPRRRVS